MFSLVIPCLGFTFLLPPATLQPRQQQRGLLVLPVPSSSLKALPNPNEELERILLKTGLGEHIKPIADLGYFGWKVPNTARYENLSEVTADDIRNNIDLELLPPTIKSTEQLISNLPFYFKADLDPILRSNRYPFGQTYVPSLYVATKHRGIDLRKDVDFLFGSYTLYFLACEEILHDSEGEKCLVFRVPSGTDQQQQQPSSTIVVTRYKEYEQNYANFGLQFERFVTTSTSTDLTPTNNIHHLHLMDIIGNKNKYRILFSGEVDGIDSNTGNPTEITTSLPYGRRFKKFFQSISNGSVQIMRGRQENWNANPLELTSIELLEPQSRLKGDCPLDYMSKRICDNLDALHNCCLRELQDDSTVMELRFRDDGTRTRRRRGRQRTSRVRLVPSDITMEQLFPNEIVTKELLLGGD